MRLVQALIISAVVLALSACTSTNVSTTQQNPVDGQPPMGQPFPGGPPPSSGMGSQEPAFGEAANTYSTDEAVSEKTFASTAVDENALRITNGSILKLDGVTIEKSSGDTSNVENNDFYGMNAAMLVNDGSVLTIQSSTIESSARGGNALFVYGEGSKASVSDTTITTTKDNSGGVDVTGGAQLAGTNLDISTKGQSSAAIRSDRGGGTINLDGGTYTTNGTGSPAIYSTADISISNATLQANASEAIVIEGKNSVNLSNVDAFSMMKSNEHQSAVMIYQSMSGDAQVGHGSFAMAGGSLVAGTGDVFSVTNTSASIDLKQVNLSLANGVLLTVSGNDNPRGWGQAGSNGADVVFTASEQKLEGTIVCDGISTLDMKIAHDSTFRGSFSGDGVINVTVDDSSKWILSADSRISSLSGSLDRVDTNGFNLTIE